MASMAVSTIWVPAGPSKRAQPSRPTPGNRSTNVRADRGSGAHGRAVWHGYGARMEVPPAAVDAFVRDGAVLLPGLLGPEWLDLLDAGVERNLAEPSEWAQQYTPDGEPGQFFGDYCSWDRIPEFRTVAFESGLADVARQLMGSTTARFFHEHVLVKEPGTREITPWHHDQPYYCVDGDQSVSFWVPLDPVPASAGVEFIAGSHRWDRWFVPRRFVDHIPATPTPTAATSSCRISTPSGPSTRSCRSMCNQVT